MSPFRIFFRSGLSVTLSSTPVFKFVVKIYIFVEKTLYLNFLLFYTVSPFLGVGWGLTTESYRITVPFDDLAGKKNILFVISVL